MTTRTVGELVLDFSVYPRMSVDSQHVSYMKESLDAGVKLPPLVICGKTLRVVDGFHRCKTYLSRFGPEYKTAVIEKKYANDGEFFADAMRYNAHHGRSLNRYDRAHCILVAERLAITLDTTAGALGMTVDRLQELKVDRTGTLTIPGQKHGESIPLKSSIRHMSGKSLTPEQAEVNKHLSGMNAMFHVNQLISLIESDLLDLTNVELLKRLRMLGRLIQKLKDPS